MIIQGIFGLIFFLKGHEKPKYLKFYIFLIVLELSHLSWHQMSKFPDFSGFWEFPKDPKVIPIHIQFMSKIPRNWENSQSLVTLF